MVKFLKNLFSKKPHYTICARCSNFCAGSYVDPGYTIPDICYANTIRSKHLDLITGEEYADYSGEAELCSEKNTGHCPDFKRKKFLVF